MIEQRGSLGHNGKFHCRFWRGFLEDSSPEWLIQVISSRTRVVAGDSSLLSVVQRPSAGVAPGYFGASCRGQAMVFESLPSLRPGLHSK